MIARTWSGRTTKAHADAYLKVVLETGIPEIAGTSGNRGAWLFRRMDGETAEFFLISLWDSQASVEAFAGPDIDKAKYYPDDDPYLLEKPEKVVHYEVVYPFAAE
ncbi:MAG: antibiotic biosynthesis monooxygenase [Phycisphaerae bacterium]|jgi:heme-degrading monooxygenase HmoA